MMSFPFHIVIAPILVPLITAALLLFFDERQRVAKAAISLASTVILLGVAILLFREVNSTVNTEIAAVVSSAQMTITPACASFRSARASRRPRSRGIRSAGKPWRSRRSRNSLRPYSSTITQMFRTLEI